MVNVGVVKWLTPSQHYFVDEEGEQTESENDAVGLKIKVEITHPEWILFGDEVGSNISQKGDGHIAGQKIVTVKNTRANMKTSHKDEQFALIGLTAACENPVMAIVIFAAEELLFEQRMGHNISVPCVESTSVENNSAEGKKKSKVRLLSFEEKKFQPW